MGASGGREQGEKQKVAPRLVAVLQLGSTQGAIVVDDVPSHASESSLIVGAGVAVAPCRCVPIRAGSLFQDGQRAQGRSLGVVAAVVLLGSNPGEGVF